jgi:hypothetical protein
MPKVWKIVACIPPLEGLPEWRECYLVALSDQSAALSALRTQWSYLRGIELIAMGEASADFVDWLDVKDGQILRVQVLS